jgi:hypothetical protein
LICSLCSWRRKMLCSIRSNGIHVKIAIASESDPLYCYGVSDKQEYLLASPAGWTGYPGFGPRFWYIATCSLSCYYSTHHQKPMIARKVQPTVGFWRCTVPLHEPASLGIYTEQQKLKTHVYVRHIVLYRDTCKWMCNYCKPTFIRGYNISRFFRDKLVRDE